MPPRRSTRKNTTSTGTRGQQQKLKKQQQTKITDRKLRTIKKHNSQHESDKFVKPMDVSDNEDNVTSPGKPKQGLIHEIKAGIHQEDLSQTDILLRKFDLDYQYGPCVGLTREERWSMYYLIYWVKEEEKKT
ncbi:hypothetical protein BDA99DRAFT_500065 [Phascolomyces articulosus]|uniref:DNA polymerase delta subunit 4 n=1 Tax=Phascolomyces articulosus TaxID=60185 RepID=A0AAD5PHR3_9FUNG|nr:hypothetical protein BDA99DRAFT_500065 [Phascolomyces articulosus]